MYISNKERKIKDTMSNKLLHCVAGKPLITATTRISSNTTTSSFFLAEVSSEAVEQNYKVTDLSQAVLAPLPQCEASFHDGDGEENNLENNLSVVPWNLLNLAQTWYKKSTPFH